MHSDDAPPALIICVLINAEKDEPVWRELTMTSSLDACYEPGELRHVETIDDLRPGTWTRLPW